MTEKACSTCHRITRENVCPVCRTASLSDDFSGLVIILDPKDSAIAKTMNLTVKGNYALKVR